MNRTWMRNGMILLMAAVLTVPHFVRGDDSEMFTSRVNPNVLLMLDTTGSMDTFADATVSDLDGNGTSNSRMDVLWKVVYTLLNADVSIPDAPPATTHLYQNISAGSSVDKINVLNENWSSFPSTATITVGSGLNAETVTYTSKSNYRFNFSPKVTFHNYHAKGEQVVYSAVGAYTLPYPSTYAQATGAYQLSPYNLTTNDELQLKARLGMMTFTGSQTNGYTIWNQISSSAPNAPPFTPSYRQIWDNVVAHTDVGGGTPTAKAMAGGRNFFTTCYQSSVPCRKNYVVMITDGEDTMGLPSPGQGGTGGTPYYYKSGGSCSQTYNAGWNFESDGQPSCGGNTGQVARSNQVIQAAKTLADDNVSVYTVGVGLSGDSPHLRFLREVLRRTAEQQGATGTSSVFNYIGNNGDNTARAEQKAFFATDATQLASALSKIFQQIGQGMFSFSAPAPLTIKPTDGTNEVFVTKFSPIAPPSTLWEGHVVQYTINADNTSTQGWDAGLILQAADPSSRRIYTADNTWNRRDFTTGTMSAADLDVATNGARDNVVNYVRGAGHDNNWKLGDIYHSKAVVVGAPSQFYYDEGYSTAVPSGQSFVAAKTARRRVVYAGANDGMLHAFHAGDYNTTTKKYSSTDNGVELFGFIPNNLWEQLKFLLPGSGTSHDYYVDASPRVADIWVDTNSDGVKQSSEWRTILISGMRKGGSAYFALDITNPPGGGTYTDANYPKPLWEYSNSSILGETWSEPFIGKVKMQDSSTGPVKDRFIAIVGGGKTSGGATGNHVLVLDAGTGTLLRQFDGMAQEVAASPSALLDTQGYIKYVYVPDLRGDLWRFDLWRIGNNYGVNANDNWVATKVFQSAGGQPAYHRAAIASVNADASTRYVYFGTGDQEAPVTNPTAGRFFCIKDTASSTYPIAEASLTDVTSAIATTTGTPMGTYGWKVNLGSIASTSNDDVTHSGEKVLADPEVFYNVVYFTTFTPTSTSVCEGGGTARLYGLVYDTAGAALTPITASPFNESGTAVPDHVFRGKGLPSSPSLSIYPFGASSLFIGFSDGTFQQITVSSPPTFRKINSWRES